MYHLALSKQQLSRFTYHWFWGLGVDKPGGARRTLYLEAIDLQSNEQEQKRILNQMQWVSQLSWLFLTLYWLFNINNYRVNSYRLHSYISLATYTKAFAQDSDTETRRRGYNLVFTSNRQDENNIVLENHFTSNARSYCFFAKQSELFYKSLTPFLDTMSNEPESCTARRDIESTTSSSAHSSSSYTRLHASRQGQAEQKTCHADVLETPPITVTYDMLDSLKVLGLPQGLEDKLTLCELNTAYRKCAFDTHPDKTKRDTADAFCIVTDAVNYIKTLARIEENTKSHFTGDIEVSVVRVSMFSPVAANASAPVMAAKAKV